MDINYLFHRQQIERSRANATSSDVARKIHEELASEYERQIEEVTDGRITFVPDLPERVAECARLLPHTWPLWRAKLAVNRPARLCCGVPAWDGWEKGPYRRAEG